MQLQFWAATDVGLTRDHNEDNYLVDRKLNLFVVADGMGGHAAGEIASSVAVHEVRKTLMEQRETLDRYERSGSVLLRQSVLGLLDTAVRQACALVYQLAQEDSERHGMGTTLSLLLLIRNRAFVGHVGDSRIYRTRGDEVTQVTEDHSVINELIKSGRIKPEEALNSPYKNAVTRAVGVHPTVEVDTFDFEVSRGDNYLLCSDGLSGYLDEDPITYRVMTQDDVKQIPQDFIDFANKAGGKDNITAVMIRVQELSAQGMGTSIGLNLPPKPLQSPSSSPPQSSPLSPQQARAATPPMLSSAFVPNMGDASEPNTESTPPPIPSEHKLSHGNLTPASQRLAQLPLDVLKLSPLFTLLGEEALEAFAKHASVIELDTDAALHFQGDSDDTLYALLEGEIRVERDDLLITTLHPGAVIGEELLLAPGLVDMTRIAHCRAQLLAWQRSALHDMMAHYPEISSRMMWGLALLNLRRMRHLQGALDATRELVTTYIDQTHARGRSESRSELISQLDQITESAISLEHIHTPIETLPSFVRELAPAPEPSFDLSIREAEELIRREMAQSGAPLSSPNSTPDSTPDSTLDSEPNAEER